MRTCSLLFCVVLVMPHDSRSQTVSLTPSVIELKGTFGQSTTQALRMTNATSIDLTFELLAQDVVTAAGRRVFVEAGDLPNSIAATAVFSPARLTIPARSSSSVLVTVTVPPGATSRAMIALFKGTTGIASGRTTSTVSLGTLMTFTLSDHLAVSASELFVGAQSDTRNVAFEIALNNGGAEPVTPRGLVVILDRNGSLAGKVQFPNLRLLPGERLDYRVEYPGELRKGRYRVLSTFDIAGQTTTRSGSLDVR
jgi:hypothetical protein